MSIYHILLLNQQIITKNGPKITIQAEVFRDIKKKT